MARLSDVWSVGVVTFEAYTGIHPFYYGKYNAPYDVVMDEIKSNIKVLTPKFSIKKLIIHLRKLKHDQIADHLEVKIQAAIP